MSRSLRRNPLAAARTLQGEAQQNAVAVYVLETLRSEGYSPEQVLAWCHPNVTDGEFEDTMSEQHGIQVSAAGIKYRVSQMVTGTVVQ